MHFNELLKPNFITYESAELIRQETVRLANRLSEEQLRMLRAALADLYTNEPAETVLSEIYYTRGAMIQSLLDDYPNNKPSSLSLIVLGRGSYSHAYKILTRPPRIRKIRKKHKNTQRIIPS